MLPIEARLSRAEVALQLGEWNQTIAQCRELLHERLSTTEEVWARLLLGAGYQLEDLHAKAAEQFEAALIIDRECDHSLLEELHIRNFAVPSLETTWCVQSEQIASRDGPEAALAFLKSRFEAVSHVQRLDLPMVWLQISVNNGRLGRHEVAAAAAERALTAELPDPNDETVIETYRHVRERARHNLTVASGPSGNRENKRCWIATAACGPESVEVAILTSFRDEVLSRSSFGRATTRMYYASSPFIAGRMVRSSLLKQVMLSLVVRPSVYLARWVLNRKFD